MDYKTIVDEVNRRAYTTKSVRSWYQRLDFIQDSEQAILEKITPRLRDKRLLDISIGAGRTTGLLLPISKDYVGIDYAPDLVAATRSKYPEAKVICRDARDLSCFEDATFDFVLVSNNGLDYMVHEDRVAAMREIYRVLKQGGLFMFSTHNGDYENFDRLPWQQKLSTDLNFIKTCAHALACLPRHLRLRKHARRSEIYAIINDNAHGYSLLTYYITISRQIEQLADVGFGAAEAYDSAGTVQTSDTTSPWIYYLTRKKIV